MENPGFESDSSNDQGESDSEQGSYNMLDLGPRPPDTSDGGTAVTYVGEDGEDYEEPAPARFGGLAGRLKVRF